MHGYWLFTAAFLLSVAAPGPDVLAVVARALATRRAAGCSALILGILGGKLVLLTAALVGLMALAEVLGSFFVLVKWVGAFYLVWLGIRLYRRDVDVEAPTAPVQAEPLKEAAVGLAMSLGNPVAILFYAALLPNALDLGHADAVTAVVLVTIVATCTIGVYSAYALLAARVGRLFRGRRARQRVNRASGAAMIGAGLALAAR